MFGKVKKKLQRGDPKLSQARLPSGLWIDEVIFLFAIVNVARLATMTSSHIYGYMEKTEAILRKMREKI